MQLTVDQPSVSLEAAEALIDAAIERSRELEKSMAIAVVDTGGELKAFRRMDGTPLLSVQGPAPGQGGPFANGAGD